MKHSLLLIILVMLAIACLSAQQNTAAPIQNSYSAETAGNYAGALDIMKTLETADNNDPFYKLRIGWRYYCQGKYNDAMGYYQKSLKLESSPDAYEGLANCYLALGYWNEAITTANNLLKDNPFNTNALLKAGYAMYMKKEYKSAEDYYLRVIKVNPFNFEARAYLIGSYYYDNNPQEAKKHYQTLKKYCPTSPFVTDFTKVFE